MLEKFFSGNLCICFYFKKLAIQLEIGGFSLEVKTRIINPSINVAIVKANKHIYFFTTNFHSFNLVFIYFN